ncbi:hypothetical protein ACWOA6_09680 [Globicatella sulfidifaciens]|uniref:hypothetical protein n=1 Tax=Globicatella sulfidifaciens TaxID=136093 RepID=UPI00190EEC96|nr:hypothetical protein [Globicatella sulfidifaciens]MDT2768197.1 hypothetical protein [Globicatella sulfidifaciens]
MKVEDSEIKGIKKYIETSIREKISPEDRLNITTIQEVNKNRENDIRSFIKLTAAIASIIFVLNITNGYSSINLSLMSRKKEIGSLYSCGMDLNELKKLTRRNL